MKIVDLINATSNQHFISQAEQRLNSCSPSPNSKKSEINCFEIAETNPPKVYLNGKLTISRNLSFQEIYTIQRLSGSERLNFEKLFRRYEDEFPTRVAQLIKLISTAREASMPNSMTIDLKNVNGVDFQNFLDEVKFIYKYKIMNGLRNPYCIKDTLKDFNFILNHALADKEALKIYGALEFKNESEENYICGKFSITKDEYKEWIRLLLLFLYIKDDGTTILDGYIEEFFKAKEFKTTILIAFFDNNNALLTDTGVVKDRTSDDVIAYMNISKNCIVSLTHSRVDGEILEKMCRDNFIPDDMRIKLISQIGGTVSEKLYINNFELLSGYNKICVKSAAKNVFSASSEITGVEILKRC